MFCVNYVLKFKWLVKRSYMKVDSCHLNRDAKGLKANFNAPHSWIFCNY